MRKIYASILSNLKTPFIAFLAVLFGLLVQSGSAFSQTYTMSNSDITTCSGTYYDPGGTNNYPEARDFGEYNITWTQHVYPGTSGKALQVAFSSFSTENNYDYLYIYNGNSTSSGDLIGIYDGTTSPGTIVSTASDGSLTFKFFSDYRTTASGWVASLSCVDPPPPPIVMSNTTQYTCSATYYDPGGTNDYPTGGRNGTTTTQTIYPGTSGNAVKVSFISFSTENNYDFLYVYNGNSATAANLIGTYSGNTLPPTITSTATDGSLTFRFYSDRYENSSGWVANLSCVVTASISTGTISPLSYCAGSTVSVPFTSSGTFTSTNDYTAQLSNASGSFSSPTAIGTLNNTSANSGSISATIPAGTAAGSGYRIRVISNSPAAIGSDNGQNITINATPATPGTISGTTPQCPGATNQTYSISAVPGATTYTWNVPTGWTITSGTGTNSIKVTTGSTGQGGNISVTAGNSCGSSIAKTLAVTVGAGTPAQPGAISGTTPQCPALTNQTYSITSVPNATIYTWTVPPGWTITAGANTNSITVKTGTAGQNGNITVTAGNTCGTSAATSFAVTVDPGTPATPGTITGIAGQCPGLTGETYTISNVTNATNYTWSVPTGWSIQSGQGTTSITVTTGSTGQGGNVSVTASNSCGTSSAKALPVTVNPGTPAQPGVISGINAQCPNSSNQTYSITAVPNATTYSWTIPSGWTITGGGTSRIITVTTGSAGQNGNITVTAGNSCGTSTTNSFAVTVNPTPTATISGDATVCKGDASPVITFNNPMSLPVIITYKVNSGTNTTINVNANSSATIPAATSTAGTFAYTLVSVAYQSGPGCSNTITGTATVTVRPTPSATISGTTTVCQNDVTPVVTFTNPQTLPVTVTYHINSGSATTIDVDASSAATVNAPTATGGVFVYTIDNVTYQSGPNCSNGISGQAATITVRPTPTATISGDVAVCKNASAPVITFTNPMDLPVIVTYNINGGGNLTKNVGANATATVTAPTSADGTFAYNLVSVQYTTGPNCSNTTITGTATVTVNPLPTATIAGTTTVCLNSTEPQITFTGADGATPYTFTYKINGVTQPTVVTTGTNTSVTVDAPTDTKGVFTYTLVSVQDGSSTACTQTQSGTAVVTVKQPAAITTDPANVTTCSTFPSSFTVTATGDDLSYQWYKDGTPLSDNSNISGSQTKTLGIAYTNVSDAGNYYVVVTGDASCGTGVQSGNALLTVYEDAVITSQPVSQAVCSGSDVSFTVAATGTGLNYKWYKGNTPLTDGGNISGSSTETLTITGATSADAASNYNVRISIPGGAHCTQANSQYVKLVVNPIPAVNSVTDKILCNGAASGAINFTGTPASGVVYTWTNDNTNIGLGAGATGNIGSFNATNSTNAPIIGNITVTPSYTNAGSPNTTCTGDPTSFKITVNPTATVDAISNQVKCNGEMTDAINFTSPSTGGTITYNWTNNTPSIGLAGTGNGNISSFAAVNNTANPVTATITVTPSFDNGATCSGTQLQFTITVNPTPKLTSSLTPPAVCNNSVFSYNPTSATAGATFSWSRAAVPGIDNAAASGTGDPNETLINSTTGPLTVIYEYTLSANGCSNTQNVSVVVKPTPTLSSTLTPSDVCSGSPFTYSATSGTSGVTFSWSRAVVAGISNAAASGTVNINETLINTSGAAVPVTYVYILTANGCSNTQNVVVNVNPTVKIAPLTQEICDSTAITPINISGLPAGNITSWSWTKPSGIATPNIPASGSGPISGILDNTTNASIPVTFNITAQADNGCATTTTATVIVDAPLVAPIVGNSQILCYTFGTPTPKPLNGTPASGGSSSFTYQWQTSANGINWSNINGANSLTYQPPAPTSTNPTFYHLVATDNKCGIVVSDSVAISRAGDLAGGFDRSGGPTRPLCNGESFSYHMESTSLFSIFSDYSVRYTWYAQNPSNINSTTPVSPTPFGRTTHVFFGLIPIYETNSSNSPHLDPSFTVTNSTNSVVNTELYITPIVYDNDGKKVCDISQDPVKVTINPIAKVNDISNQTICAGGLTNAVTFSSPTTGGTITYSWTNNHPEIGLANSSGNSIPAFTATNTTSAPITATITVIPSITSSLNGNSKTCVGESKSFTITVNPTATVTIDPTSQTICSGTHTNIGFTSNVSGATFSWAVVSQTGASGATNGSGSTIAQTLTATGSTPGTVVYSVIAAAGGCPGTAKQVTVTVNPSAAVTSVSGGTSPLCIGATTNVTANGVVLGGNGSGAWSSSNPSVASVNSSGVVTALTEGTTNIIYTVTGGCNGTVSAQQSIVVSPNAAVTSVSGTNDPICIGSTTNFTANGVILGNGTGSWSSDNESVATVNGSGVVTAVGAGTANIIYTINGGCNGTPSASHSITVNPDAAITSVTGGTTPLCIGQNTTVTANGVVLGGNGSGAWSSSNPSVASVDASGNVTALSAGTTNIAYTVTGGCNSPVNAFQAITVNANATAGTITGNDNASYCVGGFVYLSSTGDSGGSWSSSDEGIATVNSSGQVTGVGPGTVTITYTVTGGCNPPSSATTSIKFINASAAAKPNLPQGPAGAICGNADGNTFTVDAVTDANAYVWSLPSGWTITSPNHQAQTITVKTNLASGNISVVAVTACGAGPSSDPLPVALHNVWAGTSSTDWSLPGNWADGQVADLGCGDVYIPSTAHQPTLGSGSAAVGNLHILSGATLTVNNNATMQIAGVIDNLGAFDATHGTLDFNGTAAQTIKGTMFENKTVENLKVSNDALNISATGDTLNITGVVSFGTGTAKLNTGNNLTLKSTKDNTASIGALGTGNTVNGQVEVERYINIGTTPGTHAKTWQFLATPIQGQTFKQSWMEGGSTTIVGYGAQFTGTAGKSGYDGTSVAPSVKSWDPGIGNWKELDNTGSDLFNPNGYFVFVRGDRSVSTASQPAKPTTLRSKGTILTGDQQRTAPVQTPDNVFFSIGNPYPSAVDMTQVQATINGSSAPLPFFYVWNPGRSDGYYYVGAWNTYVLQGGHYKPVPDDGSGSDILESGQAFLMQVDQSHTTTVTFKENYKVTSGLTRPFREQTAMSNTAQLVTNLLTVKADGSTFLADGTLQQFDKSYTGKIDRYDARKITNSANNISVKNSGVNLIVERRAPLTEQDTIQFNLAGMAKQNFRLEFKAQGLSSEGVEGFVEDTYLDTRTPLNMEGSTHVDFAVTSDKGSYAANRFRIVFKTAVVLPVKFVSVTAVQKEEGIEVAWKTENEKAVKQYDVEKSVDGVSYKKAYTVAADNNGAGSYQWLDEQAIPGDNYYRIRMEDESGKISYSDVVKVSIPLGKPLIGIYPNPITDGIIHLQFVNQPKGRYGLRLLNPLGQTIIAKQVEHAGGNATENIKWDYNLAHGVYQLQILKPDGKIQVIKVMY